MALSTNAAAQESSDDPVWPDRRRDQFPKSFGYAIFPYPYSLPGIGQGLGLVGGMMNISDTYVDAYGIIFGGDVKGTTLGVADIHLVPQKLILDTGLAMVSAATIRSYSQRGMNTDKHDYRLLELGDMTYYGARMTATFFDRRFEVYGAIYSGSSKLESIRDQDGNVIIQSQDPHRSSGHTTLIGTRFDLTDDYSDPRKGIRFDVTRTQSSAADLEPNYYIMDYNTTAYVPLGRRSTWAFNFLKSDAVVLRTGETNTLTLQDQQNIHCDTITDAAQRLLCEEVFNNIAASNQYGTATQLGGFSRLRSYPQGRFKGAHTLMFGTEIRWNLTDERTPYNIFIMKDVRTAVQVAAFYETGSTADLRSEVGDIWRNSYGLGLRIVTASGIVFRGDAAFGKEGFEPEIFIGYPWEI
jgi:outer membrane protein assembly factor BamA